MKKVIAFVFIIAISVVAFALFFFVKEYFTFYKGYPESMKYVKIEEGKSVKEIARFLEREGVIKNATVFEVIYRLFHRNQTIKAGTYSFAVPMRPHQVLQKLIKGEIAVKKVSIPEGLTIEETAQVLSVLFPEEDFIRAASNPYPILDLDPEAKDLEGYLFPDTYNFPVDIPPEKAVELMVNNFKRKVNSRLREEIKKKGMTLRQIVTLASLIEKETFYDAEKPFISAVFYNRLKKGMPLQCDPTVIYAMKKMGIWEGVLLIRHYREVNSPYNTYLHPGLPPGPICSPGLASIKAAIYPANVDYLYFVARPDGRGHYFSRTLREHLRAVERLRGGSQ